MTAAAVVFLLVGGFLIGWVLGPVFGRSGSIAICVAATGTVILWTR